jgi:hypothetical protein
MVAYNHTVRRHPDPSKLSRTGGRNRQPCLGLRLTVTYRQLLEVADSAPKRQVVAKSSLKLGSLAMEAFLHHFGEND